LRRRLELGGQDQAGDAGDPPARLQPSSELEKPEAIDNDVVVGERDDRAARFLQAAVVGDA
jgi:hypothetical protein